MRSCITGPVIQLDASLLHPSRKAGKWPSATWKNKMQQAAAYLKYIYICVSNHSTNNAFHDLEELIILPIVVTLVTEPVGVPIYQPRTNLGLR